MRKDQVGMKGGKGCRMRRRGWCQAGFSLVELVVIVVIISLLIVFAAPDFMNWKPNINLKRVADEFYANMQKAKITAIKTNFDVMLNITVADSPCPTDPTGSGDYGSYTLWYTDEDGNTQIVAENPKTGVPTGGEACSSNNAIWESDFKCAGVCLQVSNFDSGSAGYNSRGITLDLAGNNVTFIHPKSDFIYIITQTPAGGLTREKN